MAAHPEDIDLDAEWEKQWKRVTETFATLANGKQLTNGSLLLTPEQVTQRLRQKGLNDGHAQGWEKFAVKTGKLVLKLANAGTSIAAMASTYISYKGVLNSRRIWTASWEKFFGPAQQCMNAINFLVDVVEVYHKIFENLAALFDKIADALERFELYRHAQNVLARHVKDRANQILLRLVTVCGLAHRLLEGSKARKFKNFVQSAFSKEDQGVADEIKALEELAQRELANNVIESMIQSSTTAVVAKEILETQRRAEAALDDDRQMLWLEDHVGKEDQYELWRKHMATAHSIPESGIWLEELESFQTWISSTHGNHRTLLLEGIAGSGKTILLTKIVSILSGISTGSIRDSTNVVCAFRYLGSNESLDTALRAISIQIARSNPIYRKNLYETLQARPPTELLPTSIKSLFELLFMASHIDKPIFLLLDDIHNMNDKRSLSDLLDFLGSEPARDSTMKLLLSSRLNEFDSSRLLTQIQCRIDVGQENKDIAKFSQLEIKKLPFLQGSNTAKVELRAEILDALSSEQSFTGVKLVCNELRGTTLPTTIRKILVNTRAKTDTEGGIRRMLERASKLPEEDIRDLCALLEWIMCLDISNYRFTTRLAPVHVSDLSVLLQSRYSEQSLKPLEDRLKDGFRDFFHVDNRSEVTLAFKGIKEYFEESTANQDQRDEEMEVLNMKAEIRTVRRLLKNMCDQEMYSRLGLDVFFDQKLQEPIRIHIDTDKMFPKVALDMLKLCVPAPKEDMAWQYVTIAEREATYQWLMLLGQADLSLLDQELKHRLGKAFIPMLCDEPDILRWQWAFINEEWIFANKDVADMLVTWLQDSAIRKYITQEQKAWVQQVLVFPQDASQEIMLPILRIKSRQWLCPEQLDPAVPSYNFAPFRCIRAFLNRAEKIRDASPILQKSYVEYSSSISAEQIESTAAWAKQILGIEQWSYTALCHLADTFQAFGCYEEAIHYYKAAQNLNPDMASAMLSEAYFMFKTGRKDEAIELLQLGLSKLEMQDPLPSELLFSQRLLLAEWQRSLGHWEKAIEIVNLNLINVRAYTSDHVDSIIYKLEIYAEHGRHQGCYEIFQSLAASPWESNDSESEDEDEETQDSNEAKDISTSANYDRPAKKDYESISASILDHDPKSTNEADSARVEDHRIVDGLDMFLNLLLIGNPDQLLDAAAGGGKFHRFVETAKQVDYPEVVDIRLASLCIIQNALGRAYEENPPTTPNDAYYVRFNFIKSRCCFVVYWTALSRRISFDESKHNVAIEECEQAIHAWNSVMEIVRSIRNHVEERITYWLSFLYLEMAKSQPSDTEDELVWIRKVENLWTVQCMYGDKKSNQWSKSFLLGAYFANRGRPGKSKDYLRSWVKQGLGQLLDEDLGIRKQGYSLLAAALISDSKVDALVAFSLANQTWATIHDKSHGKSGTPSGEESTKYMYPFVKCSGGCGHEYSPSSNIYICTSCVNVYVETKCYTKIVSSKHLPWLCDPSHEFLHVPPWDATKSAEIGENMVDVGGRLVSVEAWKNDIRRTWDISA